MEYKQTSFKDFGEDNNYRRYRICYECNMNYDVEEVIESLGDEKIQSIRILDASDTRQMADKSYLDVRSFLDNYESDSYLADEVIYDVYATVDDYYVNIVLSDDSKKFMVYTANQFFEPTALFEKKENEHTK